MTKIDIDKFVAFWAGMPDIDSHESRLIHCALAAQGLKFDGKEIVGIKPAAEKEIPHEPKFKAGDWVVRDEVTAQVITVTNDGYMDSLLRYHSFENEDKMHLWTIQDAKD